jgi:hypothetical protein
MVIEELHLNGETRRQLIENVGFSTAAIDNFRRDLFYSAQNSIDAFLENRPEYLHIGKAAMAVILTRYEMSDVLWRFAENNWIRYLFDKMRAPKLEAFGENKVAFVTFNFDRSLQHFLFNSLRSTFGGEVAACAKVVGNIPIIHLHGRLGWLPWQNERSRNYEPTISPQILRMCIENIKLIHEELDDGRSKEFSEAKRLIHGADRIYFLGFGFGQLNIDRLQIAQLPENRAVATATGFTQHEVSAISERCGRKVSIYPTHNIQSLFRDIVGWS